MQSYQVLEILSASAGMLDLTVFIDPPDHLSPSWFHFAKVQTFAYLLRGLGFIK